MKPVLWFCLLLIVSTCSVDALTCSGQVCPISSPNSTVRCNPNSNTCSCASGYLWNFPNYQDKCVIRNDQSIGSTSYSSTWLTTANKFTQRTYRYGNLLDENNLPTRVSCYTLVDPLEVLFDECAVNGNTCENAIQSSSSCGWCEPRKRGMRKSTVSGVVGSRDGTCTGGDWITSTSLCPSTQFVPSIIAPNDPVCSAIKTCQELSFVSDSVRSRCGWCSFLQRALNRTSASTSANRDCFGVNWIASTTNEKAPFETKCPIWRGAAKCTNLDLSSTNLMCSGNGYLHGTIEAFAYKPSELGILTLSPNQTTTNSFQPGCECHHPFIGRNCDSVPLVCGTVTCYSANQECNPSGASGCRCKLGFVPDRFTNECKPLKTLVLNPVESVYENTQFGYQYRATKIHVHAFEPGVHPQASSTAPPVKIKVNNGFTIDEYSCYLPFSMYRIIQFDGAPAFCKYKTILCSNGGYKWIRLGKTTHPVGFTSEFMQIDKYNITSTSQINIPVHSSTVNILLPGNALSSDFSDCYNSIDKTSNNVNEALVCGVRSVRTEGTGNIIPQMCDSLTEECNSNGNGCMCKSGYLPKTVASVMNPVRMSTCSPAGSITSVGNLIVPDTGEILTCDIRDTDQLQIQPQSLINQKVGALCKSNRICNGRGTQHMFLHFDEFGAFVGRSRVLKNEFEPVMACKCNSDWTGEECLLKQPSTTVPICNFKQRVKADGTGCECRSFYFNQTNGVCTSGVSFANPMVAFRTPEVTRINPPLVLNVTNTSTIDLSNTLDTASVIKYSYTSGSFALYNLFETLFLLTDCIITSDISNKIFNVTVPLEDRTSSPSVVSTLQPHTIQAFCSKIDVCSGTNGRKLFAISYKEAYRVIRIQNDFITGRNASVFKLANAVHMVSFDPIGSCYCNPGFYGVNCEKSCSINYASNSWDCFTSQTNQVVVYPGGWDPDSQVNTMTYTVQPLNALTTPYIPNCYSSATVTDVIICDPLKGMQCSSSGYGCECMPGWFISGELKGECTKELSTGGYNANVYIDIDRTYSISCWLEKELTTSISVKALCNGPGICSNPAYDKRSNNINAVFGNELGSRFMELTFDVYAMNDDKLFWYITNQVLTTDRCQCQGLRTGKMCQTMCIRDHPTLPCRDVDTQKNVCEKLDVFNYRQRNNRNRYCESRLPMSTFEVVAFSTLNNLVKRFKCSLPRKVPRQIDEHTYVPVRLFVNEVGFQYYIQNVQPVLNVTELPYYLIDSNFLCDDITNTYLHSQDPRYQTCDKWTTTNTSHPSYHLSGSYVCPRMMIRLTGHSAVIPAFTYTPLSISGQQMVNGTMTGFNEITIQCPEGWYFQNNTCANPCNKCSVYDNSTGETGAYCDNSGACQCKIGWYRPLGNSSYCVPLVNNCAENKYGLECSRDCSHCNATGSGHLCYSGVTGDGSCYCPEGKQRDPATGMCVDSFTTSPGIKPYSVKRSELFRAPSSLVGSRLSSVIINVNSNAELVPIGNAPQCKRHHIRSDLYSKCLDTNSNLTASGFLYYVDTMRIKVTTRHYVIDTISNAMFQCTTLIDPHETTNSTLLTNVHAICKGSSLCNGIGELHMDVTFTISGTKRLIDKSLTRQSTLNPPFCHCPGGYMGSNGKCDAFQLLCSGVDGSKVICNARTEQCNPSGFGLGCMCKPGYVPDITSGRCEKIPEDYDWWGSIGISYSYLLDLITPRPPVTAFALAMEFDGLYYYAKQFTIDTRSFTTGKSNYKKYTCYTQQGLFDLKTFQAPVYCRVICAYDTRYNDTFTSNGELVECQRNHCGIGNENQFKYRWYNLKMPTQSNYRMVVNNGYSWANFGPVYTWYNTSISTDLIQMQPVRGSYRSFNESEASFESGCSCPIDKTGLNCENKNIICGRDRYSLNNRKVERVPITCDGTTSECNPDYYGCRCKPGFVPRSLTNLAEFDEQLCVTSNTILNTDFRVFDSISNDFQNINCNFDTSIMKQEPNLDLKVLNGIKFIGAECQSVVFANPVDSTPTPVPVLRIEEVCANNDYNIPECCFNGLQERMQGIESAFCCLVNTNYNYNECEITPGGNSYAHKTHHSLDANMKSSTFTSYSLSSADSEPDDKASKFICNGRGWRHIYLLYESTTGVDSNGYTTGVISGYSYVQRYKYGPSMTCRCIEGWSGDDCQVETYKVFPVVSEVPKTGCGPYQYVNPVTKECDSITQHESWQSRTMQFYFNDRVLTCDTDVHVVHNQIIGNTFVTCKTGLNLLCNGRGSRLANVTITYYPTDGDIQSGDYGDVGLPIALGQFHSFASNCMCNSGFYGKDCEYICQTDYNNKQSVCMLYDTHISKLPTLKTYNTTVIFESIPSCYSADLSRTPIECINGQECSFTGIGCVCQPEFFPNANGECIRPPSSLFVSEVRMDSSGDVTWSCYLERTPTPNIVTKARCVGYGVCDRNFVHGIPYTPTPNNAKYTQLSGFYEPQFFQLIFDQFSYTSLNGPNTTVIYVSHVTRLAGQDQCINEGVYNQIIPHRAYLRSYPTLESSASDPCTSQGADYIQQVNRNRFCVTRLPCGNVRIYAVKGSSYNNTATLVQYNCKLPITVPKDPEYTNSLYRLVDNIPVLCSQVNTQSNPCPIISIVGSNTIRLCPQAFHRFTGHDIQSQQFTVIEGEYNQCPESYYFNNATRSCSLCPSLNPNTYCNDQGGLSCNLGYKPTGINGTCMPFTCPLNKWGPTCTETCPPCPIGAVCNAGPTGNGQCNCTNPLQTFNPSHTRCVSQHCGLGVNATCSNKKGYCVSTVADVNGVTRNSEFSYCSCRDPTRYGAWCEKTKLETETVKDQDSFVTWELERDITNADYTDVININRFMYSDVELQIPIPTTYNNFTFRSKSQIKWECYNDVTCDGFVSWSDKLDEFTAVFIKRSVTQTVDKRVSSWIQQYTTRSIKITLIDRFSQYTCSNTQLDQTYYDNGDRYNSDITTYCQSRTKDPTECSNQRSKWVNLYWQKQGHKPVHVGGTRSNPNENCDIESQQSIWDDVSDTPNGILASTLPRPGCGARELTPTQTYINFYSQRICNGYGLCKRGRGVYSDFLPAYITSHCECDATRTGTFCGTDKIQSCSGFSSDALAQQGKNTTMQVTLLCNSQVGACQERFGSLSNGVLDDHSVISACKCQDTFYSGDYCGTQNCPFGCMSGHGVCTRIPGRNITDSVCVCGNEWTGRDCSVPSIPGCRPDDNPSSIYDESATAKCNGPFAGNCTLIQGGTWDDKYSYHCECNPYHTGQYCMPTCNVPINSTKYICDGDSRCYCQPAYSGGCQIGNASSCSGDFCASHNGTFQSPSSCTCNPGFQKNPKDTGPFKDVMCYALCKSNSKGICGMPLNKAICEFSIGSAATNYAAISTCDCNDDSYELDSTTGLCKHKCNGNGEYLLEATDSHAAGVCICDTLEGYTGGQCQIQPTTECSGHGTFESGSCKCRLPWTGTDCLENTCGELGSVIHDVNGKEICECQTGLTLLTWSDPTSQSDCDAIKCKHGKLGIDEETGVVICNCTDTKYQGEYCHLTKCARGFLPDENNPNKCFCENSIYDPDDDCDKSLCVHSSETLTDGLPSVKHECICESTDWTGVLCDIPKASSSSTSVSIPSSISSTGSIIRSSSSSTAGTPPQQPVIASSSSTAGTPPPTPIVASSSSTAGTPSTIVSSSSSTAGTPPPPISSTDSVVRSSSSSTGPINQPIQSATGSSSTGSVVIIPEPTPPTVTAVASSSDGLTTGAVAGIAVGAVSTVAIIAAVIYFKTSAAAALAAGAKTAAATTAYTPL